MKVYIWVCQDEPPEIVSFNHHEHGGKALDPDKRFNISNEFLEQIRHMCTYEYCIPNGFTIEILGLELDD